MKKPLDIQNKLHYVSNIVCVCVFMCERVCVRNAKRLMIAYMQLHIYDKLFCLCDIFCHKMTFLRACYYNQQLKLSLCCCCGISLLLDDLQRCAVIHELMYPAIFVISSRHNSDSEMFTFQSSLEAYWQQLLVNLLFSFK